MRRGTRVALSEDDRLSVFGVLLSDKSQSRMAAVELQGLRDSGFKDVEGDVEHPELLHEFAGNRPSEFGGCSGGRKWGVRDELLVDGGKGLLYHIERWFGCLK